MKYFIVNLILFLGLFITHLSAEVAVSVPANSSISGSNVVATSPWSSNYKVSWNITQSGSLYHYVYTISGATQSLLSQGLNSFILETSQVMTSANINTLLTTTNNFVGPATYTSSGNPGMPSSMYGIKFTFNNSPTTAVIDFTTSVAPMWGDFYSNGGKALLLFDVYAYNNKFGTNPNNLTSNFAGWIPVPGLLGASTPEPTTWLILGSTLFIVLFLLHYRASAASQGPQNRIE